MRWLKQFLSSDDPIVTLVGALSEPEAQMRRELLERRGVPAMVKNVAGDSSAYGAASPYGFDLFVKRSDSELAEEILGPLIDATPPEDAPSDGPDGQANGAGDGYTR